MLHYIIIVQSEMALSTNLIIAAHYNSKVTKINAHNLRENHEFSTWIELINVKIAKLYFSNRDIMQDTIPGLRCHMYKLL